MMKTNTNIFIILLFASILYCCDNELDETVYSRLAQSNVFESEEGVQALLYSAYANSSYPAIYLHITWDEWPTGLSLQTGGGMNDAVPMQDFTWTADHGFLSFIHWTPAWNTIRDCNLLLEGIDDSPLENIIKSRIKSEAIFLRAKAYYDLYLLFGPVPLRINNDLPFELPRVSEEVMVAFIENEMIAAINGLPESVSDNEYGRLSKWSARAFLDKVYLNTKQWQKSADLGFEIINSNKYSLFPSYENLFKVENERNSEYIYVAPKTSLERASSMDLFAVTSPPGMKSNVRLGIEWGYSWRSFGNQFRIFDSFYNSFENGDTRRNPIITEYIDDSDNTIQLLGNDDSRSFKFFPDRGAQGAAHGNDFPVVRYADILLSRAEALNELNGPNQESINLINLVRVRANASLLSLSDFASTEELRNHLLDERKWEFYNENQRTADMKRMGKFIEQALARGKTNAKPFHVRFPIPQSAINANPLLIQNEGY